MMSSMGTTRITPRLNSRYSTVMPTMVTAMTRDRFFLGFSSSPPIWQMEFQPSKHHSTATTEQASAGSTAPSPVVLVKVMGSPVFWPSTKQAMITPRMAMTFTNSSTVEMMLPPLAPSRFSTVSTTQMPDAKNEI